MKIKRLAAALFAWAMFAGCRQPAPTSWDQVHPPDHATSTAVLPRDAQWEFHDTCLRDGRLLRVATAHFSAGISQLWLLEWDVAAAAQDQFLTPVRASLLPLGPQKGSVYRLLGRNALSAWAPNQAELAVVKLGRGDQNKPVLCSLVHVQPLTGYPLHGLVFSGFGEFFVCGGTNGGIYRTADLAKTRELPTSYAWKSLLEPQPCELDVPSARLLLFDDASKLVRLPYIWRYDESGLADEYTMPLTYDFAADKTAETTLRVGDKAMVCDATISNGKIWFALSVEWSDKRHELVVTDLGRTATYRIPITARVAEPVLLDVGAHRLVRLQPHENPAVSPVMVYDYLAGKSKSCKLALFPTP